MNLPKVIQLENGKPEILIQMWLQSQSEDDCGPHMASEGWWQGVLQAQLLPQHKPGKPLAAFLQNRKGLVLRP